MCKFCCYFYNNAPLFCAILKTLKDATLELKLDDQKEITDYEVIEAELRSLELVSDSDDWESDSDDGDDQLGDFGRFRNLFF